MYPESHWNYRLCTFVHDEESNGKRYYTIREVHYKNDIPVAFAEEGKKIFDYIEEEPIKNITWTLEAIQGCLKKPILDLDNFPNEYDDE